MTISEYNNGVRTFKWYFLRWVCSVAELGSGFVGIVTLGFYKPLWVIKTECWFMDYDGWLREESCKRQ